MIYKKKSSILGIIIIALLLVCISYILLFAKSNIVSSVCDRLWKYYLIMGLIMSLVFLAIKNEKIFFVYVIAIFFFFSWYSFADQSYSVVDETMNFEYVNHIIRTKQLPTFSDEVDSDFLDLANNNLQETIISTNYEAVQTPLYYIILAILGCKIKSAYFRLRLYRILGLYSICFVYYFVNKTVRYLKNNQLFDIDEECLRATYLLTIFSPGYLFRASRLNNEILVCALMAVLIYIAVKCILDGYNPRYYWGMAIVSIALFMTKTTAIYAFCVLAIVALFQKKILKAIIPVIWNIYNCFSMRVNNINKANTPKRCIIYYKIKYYFCSKYFRMFSLFDYGNNINEYQFHSWKIFLWTIGGYNSHDGIKCGEIKTQDKELYKNDNDYCTDSGYD